MSVYAVKMWGRTIGDKAMEARGNLMLAIEARSMQNYFLYTSDNKVQPPEFIGNKVSGATTGFVSASNALIVFKTRGIFLIKGDPANGFFAQTLTWDVGCSSPNSICGIPGMGVAFLATDGEVMLLVSYTHLTLPTIYSV